MEFFDAQQFVFGDEVRVADSLSDHLSVAAALGRMKQQDLPSYLRPARAAFISSYTVQGLAEACIAKALRHNIRLETYVAPYNQFSQEVFGAQSGLMKFKPHVTYALFDEPDIVDGVHLKNILKGLKERISGHVVVFLFVSSRPVGRDRSTAYNGILKQSADERLHLFDFPSFLDGIGREEHWYTKYKALGDLRLAPQAFVPLAGALMPFAVASSGATKKCLVVDLDGTLWKGIVGEDGLSGIKPDGKIQSHLKQLYERGVILAINSKNNPDDALEVFRRHRDMVLKEDHFAAMKINWNDKASNIREIAEELNIGLDSLVFVDDDEFQRGLVRKFHPEVAVLSPAEVFAYPGFTSFVLTDEDRQRGAMYAQERKRTELSSSFPTVEDFLRDLDLKLFIQSAEDAAMARISQLTQKTNQFNLATRRYSEEEIRERVDSGWRVWTAQASDRLGDYGTIGAVMVEPMGSEWRIDNFLFSCRVLGRGLEKAFLAFVLEKAKQDGRVSVMGEFTPTAKNKVAARFYPDNGFSGDEQAADGVYVYRHDLDGYKAAYPGFLKLHLS